MILSVLAISLFDSGEDAAFYVVPTIAISTTLISYLWTLLVLLGCALGEPVRDREVDIPIEAEAVALPGAPA